MTHITCSAGPQLQTTSSYRNPKSHPVRTRYVFDSARTTAYDSSNVVNINAKAASAQPSRGCQ